MTKGLNGYNLATARNDVQLKQMQDLQARKVCAFCRENIESEQKEPIELETEHWIVKKNDYPYDNTSLHLLLIPKTHVRNFSNLTESSRIDMTKILADAENRWNLDSYAFGMRSGDIRRNGGSVEHLHAHIIVGDVTNPEHEPVRFKMSSKP